MKMDESALVAAIEQHTKATAFAMACLMPRYRRRLTATTASPWATRLPDARKSYPETASTRSMARRSSADIFTSGEEIIAFSPRGPEDVPSRSARDGLRQSRHHAAQRVVRGLVPWTHDALTQRSATSKRFGTTLKDKTREKYRNLDQNQFARLQQDGNRVHRAGAGAVLGPDGMPLIGPDSQPAMSWSCEVERVKARDTVCIENIPPENIRVDKNARWSLARSPFGVCHGMMTISDLHNDGLDVPDDIGDADGAAGDMERLRRDDPADWDEREGVETDPSMRRVRVRECWIRCDYDGDGRAKASACDRGWHDRSA